MGTFEFIFLFSLSQFLLSTCNENTWTQAHLSIKIVSKKVESVLQLELYSRCNWFHKDSHYFHNELNIYRENQVLTSVCKYLTNWLVDRECTRRIASESIARPVLNHSMCRLHLFLIHLTLFSDPWNWLYFLYFSFLSFCLSRVTTCYQWSIKKAEINSPPSDRVEVLANQRALSVVCDVSNPLIILRST